MGEDIDKIDHDRGEGEIAEFLDFARDEAVLLHIEDLGIFGARLELDAGAAQLLIEELALETVAADVVVFVSLCPEFWQLLFDLAREEAAENGVARIGRGRGQNREIVFPPDVEEFAQQGLDDQPLVEAEIVEDHQQGAPAGAHVGQNIVRHDVHR